MATNNLVVINNEFSVFSRHEKIDADFYRNLTLVFGVAEACQNIYMNFAHKICLSRRNVFKNTS